MVYLLLALRPGKDAKDGQDGLGGMGTLASDATDALAIAICCAQRLKLDSLRDAPR
jgi:hypothetical protein